MVVQEKIEQDEKVAAKEDQDASPSSSLFFFDGPSDEEDPTILPNYLQQILTAARLLAVGSDSDGDDDDHYNKVTDPSTAIHAIAQALIRACRPELISTDPLTRLPEFPSNNKGSLYDLAIPENVDDDDDDEDDGTDDDSDRYRACPYQMRRVDYLRDLLRAMFPIQFDVAAAVVELLLFEQEQKSGVGNAHTAATAVILFGQWLYVAPHVTPLVSAVLPKLPCPLEYLMNVNAVGDGDMMVAANTTTPTERFTLVEACHRLCAFYCHKRLERQATLLKMWDWSKTAFELLPDNSTNDPMQQDVVIDWRHWQLTQLELATTWHAVRMAALLLQLEPRAVPLYLEKYNVNQPMVPWEMHRWDTHLEEGQAQKMALLQKAQIWKQGAEFDTPSAEHVRATLPLPSCLVDCGRGLVLIKENPLDQQCASSSGNMMTGVEYSLAPAASASQVLVHTPITQKNLSLLAAVLQVQPQPPPILICGPAGAGKSTLIRELAQMVGASLLEIHVDDETDSKTLIGCTTTTEIPGRFEWRAGALTKAVRQGRWVLLEDLDRVPMEIQAALVQLLEDRVLPLGNGQVERAHPNFRLFSTHGPKETVGRKILSPHYWAQVPIEAMSVDEMKQVAQHRFTNLPVFVIETVLNIFSDIQRHEGRLFVGSRLPSARDFFKVLSRISRTIPIDCDTTFITEGQRTLCLGESMDIFAAACPDLARRRLLCQNVVAPAWNVTANLATAYLEKRIPDVIQHADVTELGRVRIPVATQIERATSANFASTGHALRFIETLAVCVRENEPVLLVGETGGGKTTLVQQLARLTGRQVVVQNLSLQTDSTDLLGGFRPLEIKYVARHVYQEFVDLFTSTFSRKQNAQFLRFAQATLNKEQWKKLSQCFQKASKLGLNKVKERQNAGDDSRLDEWIAFAETAERFEQQRLACDSGLAFEFTEGGLVEAIRHGKWVLLDEINLASSEILQRLCGLLDSSSSSLILTERGDSEAIKRHPNFRLFAAMNPATDAGKKDLAPSIRSRFTEIYVDEIIDPIELRKVVGLYIHRVINQVDVPPEETEIVGKIVDLYLRCRELAESSFVDGGGHKPRYTLRTLSRALTAAQSMVLTQKFSLSRGLTEGFELAFQESLDERSSKEVGKLISKMVGEKSSNREQPGRRPGRREGADSYVLLKPFWIARGPHDAVDWADLGHKGLSRYVMTPTTLSNIRRLARVVASGPWPILLEGPTSAGKTSVVEYIASRCGYTVVRINNHEHTDIQEYLGGFAPDTKGSLVFQDGLLVRALRLGHWVILDELNLAPSEVLEALNRLLDDNRELYLAETNEVVKAHDDFRIFATQNPSGAYGGRKPLSRAFRNRFVEIHVGDIPSSEMAEILEKRSGSPPSHAKILVSIMDALRQRRSTGNLFAGKDSLITPRDLLRWADRKAGSKKELAEEGYMLLAERLRTEAEKKQIRDVIERCSKVSIDVDSLYYGPSSSASQLFARMETAVSDEESRNFLQRIAPTKSFLRLLTLVERCAVRKEPVLLVGDTGCGKTTAIQLVSMMHRIQLDILNCHATTETSDLLGNLRPLRGREGIEKALLQDVSKLRDAFVSAAGDDEVPCIPITPEDGAAAASFGSDLQSYVASLKEKFVQLHADASRETKRQKTNSGGVSPSHSFHDPDKVPEVEQLFRGIEEKMQKLNAIFEWADGQLVRAMKEGHNFLMDEISLADDAVIERLNSVLEPSRSLVLAEKTTFDASTSPEIIADPNFQLFATMNPGGDFGKRELSPALRSRFTEIWVTPVCDSTDVGLVLTRLLVSEGIQEPILSPLQRSMMEYFEWFNNSICMDRTNPKEELCLSVRDLVAWARFVAESTKRNDCMKVWDAYLHGAFLMHLDGLGLGTILSDLDIKSIKNKATSFLHEKIEKNSNKHKSTEFGSPVFLRIDGKFGFDPFWIREGSEQHKDVDVEFDFTAPTTGTNLSRILRAMQLAKPILLEGSPGVGKTTLVQALARASGHNLVRINLSEQTDMSDLIGSDLPCDTNSSDSIAAFRWFDGSLLSAIKAGNWVLLDELNLASQSVLEGLNSILDHRAAIFIPELGHAIECPLSFRVFAAQNPLAQGGGRKGLPRSFLNRFTKVYVDALSEHDMMCIVSKRFSNIPSDLSERLVSFNTSVHREVSERKEFGQKGSPWEFNLRDVFRLCSLLSVDSLVDSPWFLACVQDLYLKRFRSWEDRRELAELFSRCFPGNLELLNLPALRYSNEGAFVGTARIGRPTKSSDVCTAYERSKASLISSQRGAMEALARCVEKNWPCLLILNAYPDGGSLVQALGDVSGSNVRDISLTPASDVSELIGSFEQIGHSEYIRRRLDRLFEILSGLILGSSSICHLLSRVQACLALWDSSDVILHVKVAHDVAKESASLLKEVSPTLLNEIVAIQNDLNRFLSQSEEANGVFAWKDGVLVKAMLKGEWVHLRNANLCPASVLDRLNSVLEPDGFLLLSECGTDDESGNAGRIVRPHKNFRIFITMDPEYGEISRAMRNRCVEVSLLPLTDKDSSLWTLDRMESLREFGIKSNAMASVLMKADRSSHDEIHKTVLRSLAGAIDLGCHRNFCGTMMRSFSGVTLRDYRDSFPTIIKSQGILPSSLIAEYPQYPKLADSFTQSRAISILYGLGATSSIRASLPSELHMLKDPSIAARNMLSTVCATVEDWCCHLVRNDLLAFGPDDFTTLEVHFGLKALREDTAQSFLEFCRESRFLKASSSQNESVSRFASHVMSWKAWVGRASTEECNDRSPLRVSLLLSEGYMDPTSISCKATPIIYPFFVAMYEWLRSVFLSADRAFADIEQMIDTLLDELEGIRSMLSERAFSEGDNESFGFSRESFTVAWKYFKKALHPLVESDACCSPNSNAMRELDGLIGQVDRLLFSGNKLGLFGFRKLMPNSLVPRSQGTWSELLGIKAMGGKCVITDESLATDFQSIDTLYLVSRCHPALCVPASLKKDIISVLSTILASLIQGNSFFPGDETRMLSALSNRFGDAIKNFSRAALTVEAYSDDGGDENSKSSEQLQDIMASAQKNGALYEIFSNATLHGFANIQMAHCYEFIYEKVEIFVVREICLIILSYEAGRSYLARNHDLEKALRDLIDAGATQLQWKLEELAAFQVALWALTSSFDEPGKIVRVLRSILPTIRFNMSRRVWRNASHLLSSMSPLLALPSPSEVKDSPRPWSKNSFVIDSNALHSSAFAFAGTAMENGSFLTIENFESRQIQVSNLSRLLIEEELVPTDDRPWELTFLVVEILETLFCRKVIPSNLDLIQELRSCGYVSIEGQNMLAVQITSLPDGPLKDMLDPTIGPLLRATQRAWNPKAEYDFQRGYALAQIMAGLVRFHFYLPDSPVDPGRKPIAKMEVLNLKCDRDRRRLTALRLKEGFSSGCVSPSNGNVASLVADLSLAASKVSEQAGKVIERVDGLPMFSTLFSELQELAESLLDVKNVSDMCNYIFEQPNKAKHELENWQETSRAFCTYATTKYAGYSDVIDPLVESIGIVEQGLHSLHAASRTETPPVREIFVKSFHFPLTGAAGNLENFYSDLVRLQGVVSQAHSSRGLVLLAVSTLFQTAARLRSSTPTDNILEVGSSILEWVMSVSTSSNSNDGDAPKTDVELEEMEFRKQFPDHRIDFRVVHDEDEDSASSLDENTPFDDFEDTKQTFILHENEYAALCDVHEALFRSRGCNVSFSARIRAFLFGYSAACELCRDGHGPGLGSSSYGYQMMALVFACAAPKLNGAVDSKNFDFHIDADPEQARKASKPLKSLAARIVGLLHAFPSNALLLAIIRVVDRVRKLDINKTSLGKLMVGLELVLKHAQDWEQHSSIRTQIGEPLKDLSAIVASLRRLELQSWQGLLDARERRGREKAKKKWLDLFWLFKEQNKKLSQSAAQKDASGFGYIAPRWLWQGQQKRAASNRCFTGLASDQSDLIKTLDTFLLTSPLGEFETRLNMLRSFASESLTFAVHGIDEGRLRLARSLESLHKYYAQFLTFLTKYVADARAPFEKRLRDEVKLAKWDEQSYYALTSSSEQSHRKLMMILREYDEVLATTVSVVLEKELERGVKPDNGVPTNTVPSSTALFPMASDTAADKPMYDSNETYPGSSALSSSGESKLDELVSNSQRYIAKMKILLKTDTKKEKLSIQGRDETNEFCEAIFDRIKSLQTPKTTRPMKERSLVDLFKELKRHGFSNLKWSVPSEIHRFGELLLLPSISGDLKPFGSILSDCVKNADTYFLRCIAEMNRMRGEMQMVGQQQHMTQRQTEQMLSFGTHGMLLLSQQRSTLSYALSELSSFHNHVDELCSSDGSFVGNQAKLLHATTKFATEHSALLEQLEQIKILLQQGKSVWQESTQTSAVRDFLAVVVSYLDSTPEFKAHGACLVLRHHLENVCLVAKSTATFLTRLEHFRLAARELKIMPSSVLDSAITTAKNVVKIKADCKQLQASSSMQSQGKHPDSLIEVSSDLIDYCRFTAQVCAKDHGEVTDDNFSTIWNFHRLSTDEINELKLDRLRQTSWKLLQILQDTSNDDAATSLITSVASMCMQSIMLAKRRIADYLAFHRATGKFIYVLFRIFRVLIAQGFCTIESEEKDGDGEGDIAGMKFEEKDGTGMGEGEGSKDVTDQIEDEEQLLGLKSDEKGDDDNENKTGKLEKEEADKGMEMENDFEGELFDVPSDEEKQDSGDEDADKEELDREMGDGSDPNEEVIDKKLWDGDDAEEEEENQQENLDKGGTLEGEVVDDEMITREEDESKGNDEDKQGDKNDPRANKAEQNEDVADNEEENKPEFPEETTEENVPMDARDDRLQEDEAEDEQGQDNVEFSEDMELDGNEGEGDDDADADLDADANSAELKEDNEGTETNEPDRADEDEQPVNAADTEDGQEDIERNDQREAAPDVDLAENEGDGDNEEVSPDDAIEKANENEESHEGLGVRSGDGKDRVQDSTNMDEPAQGANEEGEEDEEAGECDNDGGGQEGQSGNKGSRGSATEAARPIGNTSAKEAPNPFKSPGDVEKFWHRKLNIVHSEQEEREESTETNGVEREDREASAGQFEHVRENEASTTQALGDADENDMKEVKDTHEQEEMIDNATPEKEAQAAETDKAEDINPGGSKTRSDGQAQQENESMEVDDVLQLDEKNKDLEENPMGEADTGEDDNDFEMEEDPENRVVSDMSRLSTDEDALEKSRSQGMIVEDEVRLTQFIDASEARAQWNELSGEVHALSRRLCEKMRLVLEPLVATKLRGDYRTGKRINMKRVIGYIASGYRKDKIWLRRTKPAKRNYRVLVAVDDSESMSNNGSGQMALKALAALSTGMSQLEIGEIGVAKFGNDMQMIHSFNTPFTSESGVNLMQHFKFDQARTRTALCVESALRALQDEPGDVAPMQLVLLISDGKIERDNKIMLRRLVREMLEQNILMALVIVEGNNNSGDSKKKKDNILNMKEVAFENGKPKVRSFMEDYPFPYYIILEDLSTLPETLGDALRQWFEMIGRLE